MKGQILYNSTIPARIYKMALLGLTNKEMAHVLGIGLSTLETWIRTKEDVEDMIKRGRWEADSNVAKSLYKRATGYNIKVTKIEKDYKGKEKITEEEKHIPADIKAIMFFLTNRSKDNEKVTWVPQINHNVSGKIEKVSKFDFYDDVMEEFTDAQLAVMGDAIGKARKKKKEKSKK